jgi:2-methylisocitrate lyase-like PEP mutase family enzyme
MDRMEKARRFEELHVKGTPVLLYNAWDAGSAQSILEAGAQAIATSSWSVAAAHGYSDGEERDPEQSVSEALARAEAYAAAGASGFFIPGLQDPAVIGRICERATLPVNVMIMDGVPSPHRLSQLGVARISYGPIPHTNAIEALRKEAKKAFSRQS